MIRLAAPWLTARVAVAAGFGLAHLAALVFDRITTWHVTLFAWDGWWYRGIAEHGYAGVPTEGLRFFPLLPLLGGNALGVLLVANLAALALGPLVERLALAETGDPRLARRAAWAVALTPASFVLVLPYAEPLAMVCSVVAFLGARSGRWWLAAAAGVAVGAARPTGLLLAVPVAVEAARGLRAAPWSEWAARAAAVLAPAAGCLAYLVWSARAYGDALLPFTAQRQPHLRAGAVANPLSSLLARSSGVAEGEPWTVPLHLPWLVVGAALLVVLYRHWPASYTAFAALSFATGVTAPNFASLERYALAGFPFALAAAQVLRGRWWAAGGAALVTAYAGLAFAGVYVP